MYLMDNLGTTAKAIKQTGQTGHPILGTYCDLYGRLAAVPRFLLDHAAVATAVELSLGRPKIILEAMAHLHMPYESMWIEWEEIARERLRVEMHDRFGLQREVPGRPIPERLGFLIESDGGGRKGTVTWLWAFKDQTPCEIGFVSAYFDLDGHIEQPTNLTTMFLDGNIAKLWTGNQIQLDALLGIWQTAEHKLSIWGEQYLTHVAATRSYSQQRLLSIVEGAYADVYGEYIMIWAMLLLLTASRPIVEYKKVSRNKLNKARYKADKSPLLDHTEVVLHISDHRKLAMPRGALGYARKSPRIHMVSRYLARRGDKHWIVAPYFRGSGEVVDRHVHVRK